MTPLARLLAQLHWSAADLASLSGVSERTCRRWAAGTFRTPDDILAWCERVAAWLRENPAPRKPDGG